MVSKNLSRGVKNQHRSGEISSGYMAMSTYSSRGKLGSKSKGTVTYGTSDRPVVIRPPLEIKERLKQADSVEAEEILSAVHRAQRHE